MHALEPFQYFPDHASAFAGYGGQERSPDSRYCFHTIYTHTLPGPAEFKLTLRGVKAPLSELNVRIMAHQEGRDVALVSGARVPLDTVAGTDIEEVLRFQAIQDVSYALYGYLTEPVTISISDIEIGFQGPEQSENRGVTASISPFAQQNGFVRSIKLLDNASLSLLRPISQVFTPQQVREIDELNLWPELRSKAQNELEAWRLIMPLQVLEQAGLLADGAKGFLAASPNPALAGIMQQAGCQITAEGRPCGNDEIHDPAYDFAIFYSDAPTVAESSIELDGILEILAMGGLAILVHQVPAATDLYAYRNALQQLSLRLIGERNDVVRMSLPIAETVQSMGNTDGAFALIVRKFVPDGL